MAKRAGARNGRDRWRPPRVACAAAVLLLALGPGCAHAPAPTADGGGLSPNPCKTPAACSDYLARLRGAVYDHWQTPPEIPAGKLSIQFQLAPDGKLSALELLRADSPALGESGLAAFRSCAPFERPPLELVGLPLIVPLELKDAAAR